MQVAERIHVVAEGWIPRYGAIYRLMSDGRLLCRPYFSESWLDGGTRFNPRSVEFRNFGYTLEAAYQSTDLPTWQETEEMRFLGDRTLLCGCRVQGAQQCEHRRPGWLYQLRRCGAI